MRIGYSIVSSEIIDAVNIEYGDCAKFQIVCPHCREAIFKGKRDTEGRPTTHYLSHYQATDTEARLCEMRSAFLEKQHKAKPLFDGHEQSLRHFLAVMRDAVIDAQDKAGVVNAGLMRRDITRVLSRSDRELWERPLRRIFDLPTKPGEEMAPPQMREDCANQIGKMSAFSDRSLFWCRRQASYYLDIITHITTPQAARNFSFMAAACYSVMARVPGMYRFPESREWDDECVNVAADLIAGRSTASIMQKNTTGFRKSYQKGCEDALSDALYENRIKRTFGFDIMPASKAALLASAGGSVFAEACQIPDELIRANRERMKAEIAIRESEAKRLAADHQDAASRLVILHMAARIYPVFVGLIASVPWHEMVRQ